MTFKCYQDQNVKVWPKNSDDWSEILPKKYQIQVKDFDSALEFLKAEWRDHDCDYGYTVTWNLALDSGEEVRYYSITQDVSPYYNEDDDFCCDNYFEINEIDKNSIIIDTRDWLNMGKTKKWPPDEKDN